jgi:hypothetical protein
MKGIGPAPEGPTAFLRRDRASFSRHVVKFQRALKWWGIELRVLAFERAFV